MNLLQALLELQGERGFLPEADLIAFSKRHRIPRAKIEELCSFYPHLKRTQPLPHTMAVCRDLSCYMAGGEEASRRARQASKQRDDVSFEEVSCLGRCDQAPACTLDEVAMTVEAGVEELAKDEIAVANEVPAPTANVWRTDPYTGTTDHYGTLRTALSDRTPPETLIDTVTQSGLRGMGGAGFPTGRKWQMVAAQPGPERYVICNADESEPGTFKDRTILHDLPHLVIEGMLLAGLAIDSRKAWIYIRHEYVPELTALRRALDQARTIGALGENIFGSGFDFEIEIFVSPGGYILGEETALLEALEGRRGEPRNKPPYPGIKGLHGRPTLINNVETFAHVPRAITTGLADLKFFSVSGDVAEPGVFEVKLGTSLNALVKLAGGMCEDAQLQAFLPGGASTGFLAAENADIAMDWDTLKAVGSSLGSGAVVIVRGGRDLVSLAGNLTAFFRNESCGKCVPCRIGSEKAVKLIAANDPEDLARIPALHEIMRETSICGLGQAALNPIMSVLDNFPLTARNGRDANE